MAVKPTTSVDVQTLTPFKRFIMTLGILPTSYLESMTYAELVMWFCNYLQEQVIPALNNNAEAIQEIQTFLNQLNLQDEVDNKIDEMVESGEIAEIINSTLYLQLNKYNYYNANKGVFQNENEEQYTTYGDFIDFGEPNEPPLLDDIKNKGVDIIAHWYNDFGLKSTALSQTQELGSWKWYDWSWNFTTKSTYDPSRVPLLGYYQGDDRKTLDWILYWLGKAGVNVLSLTDTGGIDMTGWTEQESPRYWEYVLINQCKNINSFKIIPWILGKYSQTEEAWNDSIDKYIDFVHAYKDKIFTYNYNNKHYAVAYCFELEGMRGTFDNYDGYTNTLDFLKGFASDLQSEGFDGLCLLCRNAGTTLPMGYNFIDDGLILFRANYFNSYSQETYQNYANYEIPETSNEVLSVITSGVSSPEHTSTYNVTGSTPELFSKALNKTIHYIDEYNLPKMLTIYNVSEWAEAGAGLIPNIQSGFGYLDAVGSCKTIIDNIDTVKVITDARNNVFSKTHDFITIKKQITSIPTGSTTGEFSELANYFDYHYNSNDYVFIISLENNSALTGVTVNVSPNFGSKRIYYLLDNQSGSAYSSLDKCYVNLVIIKKNS